MRKIIESECDIFMGVKFFLGAVNIWDTRGPSGPAALRPLAAASGRRSRTVNLRSVNNVLHCFCVTLT